MLGCSGEVGCPDCAQDEAARRRRPQPDLSQPDLLQPQPDLAPPPPAGSVPVIATRVGGLPEVIVHGETGALAPVGAVDTMASAALQILCDPARGSAAREASIRRAQEFTADRVVPQYEQLYQRVLGQ